MATHPLAQKAILLKPEDDVAVARVELSAGTILEDGAARIGVRQDIKPGHKVARRAIRSGQPVRRYGQVIGFATTDIAAGDHVHTQNLGIGDLSVASWGETLNTGRTEQKLWLILAPGMAIFFVVTVFNLVGEGLRDALDPKLRL